MNNDSINVTVKIADIEPFKATIKEIKRFLNDERIPADIRYEYLNIFENLLESENV